MNIAFAKRFVRLVSTARVTALLLLILFSTVLELLGISLFIPVIELFSHSSTFGSHYPTMLNNYLPASELLANPYALLVLLSLAFSGKAFISLAVRRMALNTCAAIQSGLRSDLFEYLVLSDLGFFQSQKQGVLLSVLGEHVIRSGQVLFVLVQLAAQWMTAAVYLAFVIVVSWKLTLLAIVPSLLLLPVVRWIGRRANHYGYLQTRAQEEAQRLGWEAFNAKKTLSAMALEDFLVEHFKSVSMTLSNHWQNTAYWSNLTSTFVQPASAIVLSLIVLASLRYQVSMAELGAFCLAFLRLAPSIQGAIAMEADITANEPSITTVFALLAQAKKEAITSGGNASPLIRRGISFENVSFGHVPNSPLFTNLHLYFPRGKMTALVGKSGAGKTTIADLAVGLYRPWQGAILVDDIPMAGIDLFSYRKKIAYVGQEPFLLHDSIRNNLTFGLAVHVTNEELQTVCEVVGAWSFIVARSEGLDSILGDRGVQLSGGQRQRLALARALLRKPELMILDEATSALDSETEMAIAQVLTQIQRRGEVTTVVIAHRYTTIRSADNIIEIGPYGAKELGAWEAARAYLGHEDKNT